MKSSQLPSTGDLAYHWLPSAMLVNPGASDFTVEELCEKLNEDVQSPRVERNVPIGPGATITPINSAWIDDPVKKEMVESHIPMRRAGTADEIGGMACFLASDDAAYITGQTIFVDGGLTLYPSFREPWSSE